MAACAFRSDFTAFDCLGTNIAADFGAWGWMTVWHIRLHGLLDVLQRSYIQQRPREHAASGNATEAGPRCEVASRYRIDFF